MYRAALTLGLFAAAASAVGGQEPVPEVVHQTRKSEVATDERAPCPPGTLPDADVCIPVPDGLDTDGTAFSAEHNTHRTRGGIWTEYEDIPRRPDRPNQHRLYRFPIDIGEHGDYLMGGFDLSQPDATQRRGGKLLTVGHGGVDLAAHRGTEVRLVNLEHQQGNADVLFVGPLIGNTVVTRHSVHESGTLREYLVFYGHLEAPASALARGAVVPEGTILGYVGDSGSPGVIHLHLEIRQVRSNVDSQSLLRGELLLNARTIACDPRNVLPLR